MLMEESVVYLITRSHGTKPFGRRAAGKKNQLVMLSVVCIEDSCLVLFSLLVYRQIRPSLC